MDVGLESNQRRLEKGADAQAGDDLVDDDAGPRGVGFEVDEKTVAQGHEDETADDEFAVAAGDLDQDSRGDGCEGETETEWENVDTTQDRASLKDGLKV